MTEGRTNNNALVSIAWLGIVFGAPVIVFGNLAMIHHTDLLWDLSVGGLIIGLLLFPIGRLATNRGAAALATILCLLATLLVVLSGLTLWVKIELATGGIQHSPQILAMVAIVLFGGLAKLAGYALARGASSE